ncbi:hypothetical protein ACGFIF_35095 [Kribbella sp. NPDC049174]|uniref:hypothetical protein n=1 Tax=Kribbella sp. NPDC049174 TaxID=3364112 RepID=UPI0037203279
MAAPSPDPEPDPAPDPAPDPSPDPDRARRTAGRLLGGCAALTAMVGFFQVTDMLREGVDQYGGTAWLGVVVAGLSLLALIALYVACTLNRTTLHTRVLGRLDLFQVSTVLVLVAITAGIAIPTRNTTALALLLPWGITYWVHGLGAVTSDEP